MLLKFSNRERGEGERNFCSTFTLMLNRVKYKLGNVMFHVNKFKLWGLIKSFNNCLWFCVLTAINILVREDVYIVHKRHYFLNLRHIFHSQAFSFIFSGNIFFSAEWVWSNFFLYLNSDNNNKNHLKIRSYRMWSDESKDAFNEEFSGYLKVNHGYPSV